jgi:hypothetical protein
VILVHLIGYEDYLVLLKSQKSFYQIELTNTYSKLEEITVQAQNNEYLYQLVIDCQKKHSKQTTLQSKIYYQQKSYINKEQVELVEAFYNGEIDNYDLKKLALKNGRFALQEYNGRTFSAINGCQLFLENKIFNHSDFFPISPLEIRSKSSLKKQFRFYLTAITTINESDSILIIAYKPIYANNKFYDGQIWLNPKKKQIIKVTFHCNTKKHHPFLPIYDTDTIQNVEMQIEKSFKEINNQMYLNYIHFKYFTDYTSCSDSINTYSYKAENEGFLYVYDFDTLFSLPLFKFNKNHDYYNISAIPYNDFFWEYNDETILRDDINSNNSFYFNENSINNSNIGKFLDPATLKRSFVSLYLHWQSSRPPLLSNHCIKTKERHVLSEEERLSQIVEKRPIITTSIEENYNLGVITYMDIDIYQDSIHVIADVLMDLDHLYCEFIPDLTTECFFNTWFDIVEIEKNKFLKKSKKEQDVEIIKKNYNQFLLDIELKRKAYIKEVNFGLNINGLMIWNEEIMHSIKIDNRKIYRLYDLFKTQNEDNN